MLFVLYRRTYQLLMTLVPKQKRYVLTACQTFDLTYRLLQIQQVLNP